MTDSERREAFEGGLRRLPLPEDRGGFSIDFWQERRRGHELRGALEREAERGPYLYPDDYGFLYETRKSA